MVNLYFQYDTAAKSPIKSDFVTDVFGMATYDLLFASTG